MTQCHSRLFYYQQRPLSPPHNGFPKGNPWEIAINLAHDTVSLSVSERSFKKNGTRPFGQVPRSL